MRVVANVMRTDMQAHRRIAMHVICLTTIAPPTRAMPERSIQRIVRSVTVPRPGIHHLSTTMHSTSRSTVAPIMGSGTPARTVIPSLAISPRSVASIVMSMTTRIPWTTITMGYRDIRTTAQPALVAIPMGTDAMPRSSPKGCPLGGLIVPSRPISREFPSGSAVLRIQRAFRRSYPE